MAKISTCHYTTNGVYPLPFDLKHAMEKGMKQEPSKQEMVSVIKDFLEMGHVDNIVAMFHRDPNYYDWTGEILDDERFNVRLGVSILFEELKLRQDETITRAVDSLVPLLESEKPHVRGEALSVLGIIGTDPARAHIERMRYDAHPLVREVAEDILDEWET